MKLTRQLQKLGLRLGYPILQLYWFIFRSTYKGAKVVITCGDEMLLVRHTYGDYYWTFAGGSLDKNETPLEAAVREVKEELGIDLDPAQVVATGSFKTKEDHKDDTVYCFYAEVPKKDFILNDIELAEAHWFPINNPPIHLGVQNAAKIFECYKNYKKVPAK